MKKIFSCYFFAAMLFTAISCRKINPGNPVVPVIPVDSTDANRDSGKYTNGFFILGTGYDTINHDVSFYSYDKDSVILSGYRKENLKPSPLNVADLKFATIYRDRLYLILKGKGPLVVVNPSTLKEIGRVNNVATLDPHVFLGINEEEGLISCHTGIYRVSLSRFRFIGQAIGSYTESFPAGAMVRSGDYVFALIESSVVIFKVKDYSVVKRIKSVAAGFTVSKDGNVWAIIRAGEFHNFLLRINSVTLAVDTVKTPYQYISYYYHDDPTHFISAMAASTKDNIIYLQSGPTLFSCVLGKSKPQFAHLFEIGNHRSYMGNVVNYNAEKDQLVVLTKDVVDPWWKEKSTMYFLDPRSGAVKKTVSYNGRYEPVMAVFH